MVYSSNTTNHQLRDSGSVLTQNTTQKCALGILANFLDDLGIRHYKSQLLYRERLHGIRQLRPIGRGFPAREVCGLRGD